MTGNNFVLLRRVLLAALMAAGGVHASAQSAMQNTAQNAPQTQEVQTQEPSPAQTPAAPDTPTLTPTQVQAQQDLYLDAMKAIAEGRQADASAALVQLIDQEPQHAGAWLDLAIIQCSLGHADEAEHMFQVVESRFSPPPVIQQIIAEQRKKGCKAPQQQRRYSITLGHGDDSNANQGTNLSNFNIGSGDVEIDLQLLPEYLAHHDEFSFLAADYSQELDNTGTIGFTQLLVRDNDTLTAYNTSTLVTGLDHPWRFKTWTLALDGTLAMSTLGDKLYQKQGQFQTRITPDLPIPSSMQASLVSQLSHIEYPTVGSFDSNTFQLGSLLAYRTATTQASGLIGYTIDHALADDRPGGDRMGWSTNFQLHSHLASYLDGELGWSSQIWNSRKAYSPGIIDEVRHQDTQVLRSALIIPFTTHQSLNIELRYTRDLENIPIFQYTDRVVQVSWKWQNF